MADARYGRLFTEEDVKDIVDYMASGPEEREHYQHQLQEALGAAGDLTFPADEPLFLLRASDPAAPEAIDEYELAASRAVPAAAEFRAWQQANPDRVKAPD